IWHHHQNPSLDYRYTCIWTVLFYFLETLCFTRKIRTRYFLYSQLTQAIGCVFADLGCIFSCLARAECPPQISSSFSKVGKICSKNRPWIIVYHHYSNASIRHGHVYCRRLSYQHVWLF